MWRSLLALALATGGLYAQEVARTGTLTGFVTDPTGLGVSGVKVTAVNQETKFTSAGMTCVRTGIELLAGESPRIDVQLEVGGITESIVVSGAAPLIETDTATVSATVPHEEVMRLTLLKNRSFNVMMCEPGAVNTSEATFYVLGQRGQKLLEHYCAVCHGASGEGDGFNAFNLNPKPRNLADRESMRRFSDQQLLAAISQGGLERGKSNLMPPWGNTLNERQVRYLVAYLRTLGEAK